MFAFVLRRVFQAVIVMLTVGFIAFGLFRFVGDPITNMVGQDTTAEQREQIREQLGLNDAFFVQYGRYLGRILRGEFGVSYRLGIKVADVIVERAPATLELAFCAAIFALALGVPLGVYTGLNRDSPLSRFFLTVSLVGISLPTFLIGILLILVFAVILGWLPSFGRGDVIKFGFWSTGFLTKSGVKALILPAITLGLFQLTLIMRLVRSEMLEVLRTDYIKFARARGLTDRAI
ncbi:MAG: ABC transporter permease, partial [Alphaproteobacteria bacterium]|nr:ABC transporter permease [Alphaproteobacteria bacterium]